MAYMLLTNRKSTYTVSNLLNLNMFAELDKVNMALNSFIQVFFANTTLYCPLLIQTHHKFPPKRHIP